LVFAEQGTLRREVTWVRVERMMRPMPAETVEPIARKRFTVDEFHRLYEVGILPESLRFELIRGEIVEMPLPQSPHSGRVNRLIRVFTSTLGDRVVVSVQSPLYLDEYSEPLPDVAVLKPRDDFYETALPEPQDVLLLVEVSHTSVSYDRNVKTPLYAEAGIADYWQVDVKKACLIVNANPSEGSYREMRILKRGESVSPKQLPQIVFAVDDFLG
jgi:Uma2 family endonuclease